MHTNKQTKSVTSGCRLGRPKDKIIAATGLTRQASAGRHHKGMQPKQGKKCKHTYRQKVSQEDAARHLSKFGGQRDSS